ncbi:MAG TPA: hypothetical protein VMT64_02280, partial [Candidatus Binataceae bacterium]|nr:hypothetical protein [Candidatus Binataceae bacterium]
MKIGKISGVVALAFVISVAMLRSAMAGANPKTAIFVDNSQYVTAYPTGSGGDVSPIAITTDMINPGGIARDANGFIYVAYTPTNTIAVYAPNANGNVPPLAV